MSMVGYILGLGDRHPSNLMLDTFTGKILHIDFGDCFEVAMVRDKYPEKIPFRLTRMLTCALEVSGVEGTFRSTSEIIMRVLRDNKESLMAMLQAFVHDPLINWRLLNEDRDGNNVGTNDNEGETLKRSRSDSMDAAAAAEAVETGSGSVHAHRGFEEHESTMDDIGAPTFLSPLLIIRMYFFLKIYFCLVL